MDVYLYRCMSRNRSYSVLRQPMILRDILMDSISSKYFVPKFLGSWKEINCACFKRPRLKAPFDGFGILCTLGSSFGHGWMVIGRTGMMAGRYKYSI